MDADYGSTKLEKRGKLLYSLEYKAAQSEVIKPVSGFQTYTDRQSADSADLDIPKKQKSSLDRNVLMVKRRGEELQHNCPLLLTSAGEEMQVIFKRVVSLCLLTGWIFLARATVSFRWRTFIFLLNRNHYLRLFWRRSSLLTWSSWLNPSKANRVESAEPNEGTAWVKVTMIWSKMKLLLFHLPEQLVCLPSSSSWGLKKPMLWRPWTWEEALIHTPKFTSCLTNPKRVKRKSSDTHCSPSSTNSSFSRCT